MRVRTVGELMGLLNTTTGDACVVGSYDFGFAELFAYRTADGSIILECGDNAMEELIESGEMTIPQMYCDGDDDSPGDAAPREAPNGSLT